MKQKIKVTKLMIEEALFKYDHAMLLNVIYQFTDSSNGHDKFIMDFPDSIEVEVEVPERFESALEDRGMQETVLDRLEKHMVKKYMEKLAKTDGEVIQSDLPDNRLTALEKRIEKLESHVHEVEIRFGGIDPTQTSTPKHPRQINLGINCHKCGAEWNYHDDVCPECARQS